MLAVTLAILCCASSIGHKTPVVPLCVPANVSPLSEDTLLFIGEPPVEMVPDTLYHVKSCGWNATIVVLAFPVDIAINYWRHDEILRVQQRHGVIMASPILDDGPVQWETVGCFNRVCESVLLADEAIVAYGVFPRETM